jgi:7-keto-8-aminopelargonate synthetase-like enzyme
LRNAGFAIGNPQGAVTSIFTRGVTALHAVKLLEEHYGIIVNPVMYPAVPYGTSIIRMTPSALHSTDQMQRLVDALVDVAKKIPLLEGNNAAAQRFGHAETASESHEPNTSAH